MYDSFKSYSQSNSVVIILCCSCVGVRPPHPSLDFQESVTSVVSGWPPFLSSKSNKHPDVDLFYYHACVKRAILWDPAKEITEVSNYAGVNSQI